MSSHFDVVVLGAGPGGYVAAIRAAQLGKKTAIIEKEYWGGVCLNVGCIPTKSLLRNAELAHIVTKEAGAFGIGGDISVDFGKAYSRSREVSDRMVKGVHYLMKKNKITEFSGWGEFTGPKSVVVKDGQGQVSDEITFDNCIIAAGSTVKTLPGTQLSDRVVTYKEQILSDEVPGSIIIAGSGAIGTEFAYVLANYGAQVTIVEYLDRMVPNEDPEVSKELTRAYKKLGERGAIEIDDFMRTSVPGIYAIGDCTAKLMLAHTAEAQGVVAAETIAGAQTMPINYAMIPRVTYCQPQVATFGYSEAQAKEQGYDVKVSRFPFSANGKAWGMGDGSGFVKVVADARHNELLGATIIGHDVSELIPALTVAQMWDITTDEVARNIFPHPSLSEALKDAVEGIGGEMINI